MRLDLIKYFLSIEIIRNTFLKINLKLLNKFKQIIKLE